MENGFTRLGCDYGVKNNKGYRYILVVDNFSKFGWTVPLKNKLAQAITESFSNNITNSKRKPNLIETDRGKEFYNNIFKKYLKQNNIYHYSRFTDKGPSIAERFNSTIRDLLKKPVFEKGNANWLDKLPLVIKKYNNNIHHSTKMTPIDASKRKIEEEIYNNLQDKRTKRKPKYKVGDFVKTADVFSLRVIQQIGALNSTKLLKLLMITYQAIILIFYLNAITKLY